MQDFKSILWEETSQHSKHACKTCLIQLHDAKHVFNMYLALDTIAEGLFFSFFLKHCQYTLPNSLAIRHSLHKNFPDSPAPRRNKTPPNNCLLFTETAGSEWLSHLSFYCLVSTAEGKVWLLLMSGDHSNHEFLPALLILPVVFILIIFSLFPVCVTLLPWNQSCYPCKNVFASCVKQPWPWLQCSLEDFSHHIALSDGCGLEVLCPTPPPTPTPSFGTPGGGMWQAWEEDERSPRPRPPNPLLSTARPLPVTHR